MPATPAQVEKEITRVQAAGSNHVKIFQLIAPWSTGDLKKSYHRLVRLFHPDRHVDEAMKTKVRPFFIIVQESYEQLRNPKFLSVVPSPTGQAKPRPKTGGRPPRMPTAGNPRPLRFGVYATGRGTGFQTFHRFYQDMPWVGRR